MEPTGENWIHKKIGEDFIVLNSKLGEGAFGVVYKGFRIADETIVACKAIDIQNFNRAETGLENVKQEIKNLQQLYQNKNVTRLIAVQRTTRNIYMFLEYCQDGDLKEFIKKRGYLAEAEAILFFRHICQGFKGLTHYNIIHRDIKPANILLKDGVAKISDFGFSRVIEEGCDIPQYFSQKGTPLYMSPQILKGEKFSSKCDVWSLGIVLYEMLYGKTPWNAKNQMLLDHNISTKPLSFPEEPPRSQEIKSLLREMLQYDEQKRISWKEIFEKYCKGELSVKLSDDPLKISQMPTAELEKSSISPDQQIEGFDNYAQFYLEQNKVQGYLNKEIEMNSIQALAVESAQSDVNSLNVSKVVKKQQEDNKDRQVVLKIHEFLQYERNIEFFFIITIQKLTQTYNSGALDITKYFSQELLFLMSRHHQITQKKLQNTVYNVNQVPVNNLSLQDWKVYLNSKEYQKILQLVNDDIQQSRAFYNYIMKCNIESFQEKKKNLSENMTEEQEIIRKFENIFNDDFQVTPDFKALYIKYSTEIMKKLMKTIEEKQQNINKDVLILTKYIQICKQPYKFFAKLDFDFNLFYESMERASVQNLLLKIKQ